MKIAFVRTKTEATVFHTGAENRPLDAEAAGALNISLKDGSSSKNVLLDLVARGLVDTIEEWKFWDGKYAEIDEHGLMPVKLFPIEASGSLDSLRESIAASGQPDILWVEGNTFPDHVRRIFDLCPDSFKMVYSKNWQPWKIENLQAYDLCLVDEEVQVRKVKKRHPNVACGIWNKLIDYDGLHYPEPVEKIYDICYVAYLRVRKNHDLLFRAMAATGRADLTCVCVGGDREGYGDVLRGEAKAHGLNVEFTGEVPKPQVNRFINQSRMGVMPSLRDAAPRATIEYIAADVPVLVNSRLAAGARYVGERAGLVRDPDKFHEGIVEILDNLERFEPRAWFLEQFSRDGVTRRFLEIMKDAGMPIERKKLKVAHSRPSL